MSWRINIMGGSLPAPASGILGSYVSAPPQVFDAATRAYITPSQSTALHGILGKYIFGSEQFYDYQTKTQLSSSTIHQGPSGKLANYYAIPQQSIDTTGYGGSQDYSAPIIGTTGVKFDYYISTTGNDSNPGTLSQPWALTSLKLPTYSGNGPFAYSANQTKMVGKRVGVIAGTYNVMTIFGIASYPGTQVMPPLVFVPGGTATNQTYLASCDASGNYAPVGNASGNWAILNMQGTAANNAAGQSAFGSYGPQSGYMTIDGMEVTNGYYHLISAGYATGGYSYITTRVSGVVIQNNYCHGVTNQIGGENATCITMYTCHGAIIQNNYVTDITDNSNRATSIEFWNSDNCIIQYNTMIGSASQAGGFFIKNQGLYQNTVRYNYINMSASGTGANSGGICADLNGTSANTTSFYNNIVVSNVPVFDNAIPGIDGFPNTVESQLWYNNTLSLIHI